MGAERAFDMFQKSSQFYFKRGGALSSILWFLTSHRFCNAISLRVKKNIDAFCLLFASHEDLSPALIAISQGHCKLSQFFCTTFMTFNTWS